MSIFLLEVNNNNQSYIMRRQLSSETTIMKEEAESCKRKKNPIARQLFIKYYNKQKIVEDMELFLEFLDQGLPITFRTSPISDHYERVQNCLLERSVAKQLQLRQVSWFPSENCWELSHTKAELRLHRQKREEFGDFQNFLCRETAIGSISRQELVSMIPPLLLQVEPHHTVLDMCASPGSKTTQLLEALQGNPTTDGIVIGNDASQNRAFMLAHQCNRLGSPSLCITCNQGQWFPGGIPFDRVLCDVPCSGDGTLRKSQVMWKTWNVGKALTLHGIQLSLALRAASLLKVGGLMVYSTCTFNPIENEAVVAELLAQSNGRLSLIDTNSLLPGLKRRQGLTQWSVAWQKKECRDSDFFWFDKWDEVPSHLQSRIKMSMFPQNSCDLTKCMRILPHDNNTGGFFIALIRKDKEFEFEPSNLDNVNTLPTGVEDEKKSSSTEKLSIFPSTNLTSEVNIRDDQENLENKEKNGESDHAEDDAKMNKLIDENLVSCSNCSRQFKDGRALRNHVMNKTSCETSLIADPTLVKEEIYPPFEDLALDQMQFIQEFYGISEKFPMHQLYTRSKHASNVYYLGGALTSKLLDSKRDQFLNIVQAGVRMFVRDRIKYPYHRIAQESLRYIFPFITKRVVSLDYLDVIKLLKLMGKAMPFEELSESSRQTIALQSQGPIVVVLEPSRLNHQKHPFTAWIGRTNISVLISKDYAETLIAILL